LTFAVAVAAALAVRRYGYSILGMIWAGIMVWGLCLVVMMAALRILNESGVDGAQWMGLVAALFCGGLITREVLRVREP
jgi:Co/Zn/Cd efflux system component